MLLPLLLIVFLCGTARANDYLEKEKHYKVYASGIDKIHFKIPVWSYGKSFDYYLNGDSYASYTVSGQSEVKFVYFKSDRYDENENKNTSKGTAYLWLRSGEGTCVVTSMASGVDNVVNATSSWTGKMYVTQKEDDDNDYVTFLEFDWYPPEALNGKEFTIKMHIGISKSYTGNENYTKNWDFGSFSGNTNIMTPQLYTPYIYQVNDGGPTGYGYAAIPYMLFNNPISYVDPSTGETISTTSRSGHLYVMTNDTVQEQIKTKFTLWRNEAIGDQTVQTSTAVDIPPYHRIYNFRVTEETDTTGTYTGANIITWTVKNPALHDIVDGDYFEVQRALRKDFSDARTLTVMPLVRGEDKTEYRFVDNSRDTWTGNATVYDVRDTIYNYLDSFYTNPYNAGLELGTSALDYVVKDNHGTPRYIVDYVLHCPELKAPGVPVYYRIRRASSSVWGWGHEFTHTSQVIKHNFLSPLAAQQPAYTKDADYDNNHKVHFTVKIDNKNTDLEIPPISDFTITAYPKKSASDKVARVIIDYPNRKAWYYAIQHDIKYSYRAYNASTNSFVSKSNQYHDDGDTLYIEKGWSILLQYPDYVDNPSEMRMITINGDCKLELNFDKVYENGQIVNLHFYDPIIHNNPFDDDNDLLWAAMPQVKDSLYRKFVNELPSLGIGGKSMWDYTARLVLTRTVVETGQSYDFVIPQDSIRREDDGTWTATYTDVADQACMHYTYSVRIDQSNCDLRVEKDEHLRPITLTGPSLYYDEGADLSHMTASQGDAQTMMKNGVLVQWEPTNNNYDDFALLRLKRNSSNAADTLLVTTENSYLDRTAVPGQHYDYTIVARYNCNGVSTTNARQAEGWRTTYGEISGNILMPDNTGMAGVEVVLQSADGTVLGRRTTNATGAYLFDSLTYDISRGSSYIVMPTSQYGIFSFNNTSSSTATVSLSAADAVAHDIDFVNTSTVRLTGRVLYHNSTIPVAGAYFLLNGDTVRHGNAPLESAINGNFELTVPSGQPCRLQVVKKGHTFEGDGILHVEGNEEYFALTNPLDGVRFYDLTRVRLVGRVAGGNDQSDLPVALGLGTYNVGDNLQIVLQLEGDNTAQIVHDPDNLDRDTLHYTIDHLVYENHGRSHRSVGTTQAVFERKRIIINPDPLTGEYAIDLFPVKYKVVQATAEGYATLFASGTGSETFDLTNAPFQTTTATYSRADRQVTIFSSDGTRSSRQQIDLAYGNPLQDGDSTSYNARYDRIYHNPVQVSLTQLIYGIERDGLGEPSMEVSHIDPSLTTSVNLYTKQTDGTIAYLLGYPVFNSGRKYQFLAQAYEDYFYNNDIHGGSRDRVPLRGGSVTVSNGLHNASNSQVYDLDNQGRNQNVWLMVDNLDANNIGTDALRTVSIALEQEGQIVETSSFKAFISGTAMQEKDLRATESEVVLLDIVRDPGGAGSSAWVESGSTYSYSYKESYKWEAGLKLTLNYGLDVTSDVGVIATVGGAGSYTGTTFNASKQFSMPIPITHEWQWGYQYDYTFTTTDRISTSASSAAKNVGSNADVFLGTTISQLAGKVKTIALIGDSLYRMRQPAIEAGTMQVIAQGIDAAGKAYYLVTGQKIALGTEIGTTFAYSQHYVLNTVIPELALERQNLLMTFASRADALAAANAAGEPVYWYHPIGDQQLTDTLAEGYYEMVTPRNGQIYNDRVAALDNMILQWMTIVYQNEKEKVLARTSGRLLNTYSVSYGNTLAHSETFTAAAQYNEMPQGWDLIAYEAESAGTEVGANLLSNLVNNLSDFWDSRSGSTFGMNAAEALMSYTTDKNGEEKTTQTLGTKDNASKFSFEIEPVIDYESDDRNYQTKTDRKAAGFNIEADGDGDITVSVYRGKQDDWDEHTEFIRDNAGVEDEDMLYGSYIFFTQAGATFCPHEDEERTILYNKGTILSNGTQWLAKPEMTASTYEIANVAAQNAAYLQVQLMNNGQLDAGVANDGHSFTLLLDGESNPDGAQITVDGQPLASGVSLWIVPGQPVTKTIKIERGTVDDYNDLTLLLYPSDCVKTITSLKFSVHFMPEASPVNIASPHPNWVMNTLSSQDSNGYYLPIDIRDFDINYKNFDHIEFQYKLSTESDEMWVNQCSFYADDSLYALATGNKAMIENGRITPLRFYGERDPMEQRYDLRAVAFSRHGSDFVTRSSAVVSGVKDTRPPRVFGEPEPVNAILGVGDNLKLRFNEPIAGNYLDEDNNFQILGVTNETGFVTSTSLGFDGTDQSYAATQVTRNLSGRSFSLDMLVAPASTGEAATFFTHGEGDDSFTFGLTADNRLYVQIGEARIQSAQLSDAMLTFTRVIMTYDAATRAIRFYAGTQDVTDPSAPVLPANYTYNTKAALVFGKGFRGNMLEARLWTKALTPAEIGETHMKYLTGYEQELVAYYRMNEGQGADITDIANGATLTTNGTTWAMPKGISLHLDSSDHIALNSNLLGRNDAQDETFMLWFRNSSTSGDIFSAGYASTRYRHVVFHYEDQQFLSQIVSVYCYDSTIYIPYEVGTRLFLQDGKLMLTNDGTTHEVSHDIVHGVMTADTRELADVTANEWHHLVMTINRTYNNVAIYLDGKLVSTFAATDFKSINGPMYLGGNGFEGNIDEVAFFEQALPKSLVEQYDNNSPAGDEMGLMGYLPFEEQHQNANGVMELVFSVNDRREYRAADGTVIDKVVPLVVDLDDAEAYADRQIYAPVRNHGRLTKLYFDWAFNGDELLINLNMPDREINKQSLFVTVRDVEDLNGNPMPSPVMWTAFVDRNSLKWDYRSVEYERSYNATREIDYFIDVSFTNTSGRRHQYRIESLPQWLTIDQEYGSIDPLDYKNVRLRFADELPVGVYADVIYLTDENGLSEPLSIELDIRAFCPWDDNDFSHLPSSMSICGRVMIDDHYDTDPADKVAAFYRGECLGLSNVSFDNTTGRSELYLTVRGMPSMEGEPITFMLWQASTGRILPLHPSADIRFADGSVVGCSNGDPILFTTGGSEAQQVDLTPGWNWISFNILLDSVDLNTSLYAKNGWGDGDLVKDPSSSSFATFSESTSRFVGTLQAFETYRTYMVYSQNYNTISLSGYTITDSLRHITLRGGGAWSAFPCLLSETTSITEAMADYYDEASEGDLLKSHDQFAVFSRDGKWVGNLTAVRPGEGYLFRRQAKGDATVNFYNHNHSTKGTKGGNNTAELDTVDFHNSKAATNMTIIAMIDSL